MPQDWTNLIGGFAQGFGNAKNQARDRQFNEDYKKILMDENKAKSKLVEAQINKLGKEADMMGWGMGGPIPAWAQGLNQNQGTQQPPQAQGQPSPGPVSQTQSQQPLPQMAAAMQYPNPLGEGRGGGLVQMSPEGQKSTIFKNPYNVKWPQGETNQALFASYGGRPAPDGIFTQFPTPEAGVAAATHLIQKDYANLSVAQAIERFAPTGENPGTPQRIKETAAALGVSPNTRVGDIPTAAFMQSQVKYESPTQINPAIWGGAANVPISQAGQAQTQPQQAPSLTQFQQPQRGVLTREKFLEGYMKKNFGVEPDEVTISTYGDHKLVTDKKKGTPLFMIAGQGKTEMVDVETPQGKFKRPMLIPPSPIPAGIPVINMAGNASNVMSPGGIQTGPAPAEYQEVEIPGQGKFKVPVPKAQVGGTPIATEPPKGANASEAGRIQLAQSGLQAHQELENMIFDTTTGKSNWGTLATAIGPGVPWTKGRNIKSLIFRASDAIIRAATGAALNREELTNYAETYAPSVFDNEATIQSKMQGLRSFLNGYLEKMDPTEAARLRMGPIVGPMGKSGFNAPPPPATSMIPPVKGKRSESVDPLGIR